MELITDLLIIDGISSALIVVLIFIWRDISRMTKQMDSFNSKIYKDGNPIFQSVKECETQMHTSRNDINNIGMKVHQNTNDLVRIEMRLAILEANWEKLGKGE